MEIKGNLRALLDRTVAALGCDLVEARLDSGRLFLSIDAAETSAETPAEASAELPDSVPTNAPARGVTVADCERVSRQLKPLLAAEEIDCAAIEVSSPGPKRPLVRARDFARFAGRKVRLQLREPVDGATRVGGVLRGLDDEGGIALATAAGAQIFTARQVARAELDG